jgi:uncharacterized protein YndB with AHSA1/START domain
MPTTEPKTFIADPGTSQVIVSRYLAASPEKVYRACTDPELIVRWWGPHRFETIIEEFEPRRGGRWRFIHKDGNGNEYGFNGVIHDLLPNERMTQTFEFEGMPGHVVLEQLKLEPEGAGTRVTTVAAFTSVVERDALLDLGMEEGRNETYDRLEALVQAI